MKNRKPREFTSLKYTGKHELVHSKVEPVYRDEDGCAYRITGCKEVVISPKGDTFVYHSGTYEAQTELLTLYASIPREYTDREGFGFKDLSNSYLMTAARGEGGYLSEVIALGNVLEKAFDNFQEGVDFLGNCYFGCHSQEFFEGITKRCIERSKNKEEAADLMQQFYKASALNNKIEMGSIGKKIEALEINKD